MVSGVMAQLFCVWWLNGFVCDDLVVSCVVAQWFHLWGGSMVSGVMAEWFLCGCPMVFMAVQ